MKYLIELPELRDADGNEYEPTGEYRYPSIGERYLSRVEDGPATSVINFRSERFIILRRKWTWPSQLKGWGFAMDKLGCVYLHQHRAWLVNDSWVTGGNYVHAGQLTTFIDFELPLITDWRVPVLNPHYKPKEARPQEG